jgi:hypothetical protein
MISTLKLAIELSGRVSDRNDKMPGTTFATDPFACKVGEKLALIPGSTCSGCYARRIAKYRANVAQGWAKNQIKADNADRDTWIAGIVYQLKKKGEDHHRWFDAGDLSSVEQLDRIVAVCKATPEIRHWLPTRELKIVRDWAKDHIVPRNLIIRLSSTMIDDKPRTQTARALGRGIACSTVHRDSEPVGHACPARDQGNQCGDCRACWDRRVRNVSYPKH